jgi:hypothetical protein
VVVVKGGISLITCGLDHWYRREDGSRSADLQEYRVEEWRLQERLDVDHFRLPPDYRERKRGQNTPNTELTLPFLRFPQWHFCRSCRLLAERPSAEKGRARCPECERQGKRGVMYQVRFVAMCEAGHLQDFPWREWVHRSVRPTCRLPMRITSIGSAGLAAEKVKCQCGAERTLAGAMNVNPDSTTGLSRDLEQGKFFACQGRRPWLGPGAEEECRLPLHATLRSASNAYFAQVVSSIYLPVQADAAVQELIELLENPPLSSMISIFADAGLEITPEILRKQYQPLLHEYGDSALTSALHTVLQRKRGVMEDQEVIDTDDEETRFRRAEFEVLRTEHSDQLLRIRAADMSRYDSDIARFFSRIMLIEKLRETRVLTGFTRMHPENGMSLYQLRTMLWRQEPSDLESWLPAHIVYGEGIFLEVDEKRLQAWERQSHVVNRIEPVVERYKAVQQSRKLSQKRIGPRFVLLHTLAHLIINRLTYECGYSTAALRERLYISDDPRAPMAGILIYTADGDVEGTMGGLVRMGKAGYLEPVVRRALESAMWCSADPVCMELGEHGGQGPDSCNLAACHNCALVPETTCEEFNRFLDRYVVVGGLTGGDSGFFVGEHYPDI